MSESYVEGTAQCVCGGEVFVADNPPTNGSIVACKSCGKEIGTYGDVNDEVRKATFGAAQEIGRAAIMDLRRNLQRMNKRFGKRR